MTFQFNLASNSREDSPYVAIILAAYNGARFLREQIESIQEQSWKQWKLFVRDDGSSDDSWQIVNTFLSTDSRIQLLDNRDHLGCLGNYGVLLETAIAAGAHYVFLADQDDVWMRDKISLALQEMQAAERRYGPATPLLVHSDLTVVDSELRLIHKSFMTFSRIRHISCFPLNNLLVQNFVTGCTVLVNRSLLLVALPFPSGIVVHDWWLAMCAASIGVIRFVPTATVKYRQHDGNVIGAPRIKKGLLYFLWHRAESSRATARGIVQVRQLLNRLDDRRFSDSGAFETVRLFCRAFSDDISRAVRPCILLWIGIRRQSLTEQVGWLCEAALLSKTTLLENEFNTLGH